MALFDPVSRGIRRLLPSQGLKIKNARERIAVGNSCGPNHSTTFPSLHHSQVSDLLNPEFIYLSYLKDMSEEEKKPAGGHDDTPVPARKNGYTVKFTFHRASKLPMAGSRILSCFCTYSMLICEKTLLHGRPIPTCSLS